MTIPSPRLAPCLGLIALCLLPAAKAQVYEKVYSFTDQPAVTIGALLTLLQGRDGNFYGTYSSAGIASAVFKILPNGTVSNLLTFNGANGNGPTCLIEASDGFFYGTTKNSNGTIFRLTHQGTLTTMVTFNGDVPNTIVQGYDGNFYGTTNGSSSSTTNKHGTVFRMTSEGELTILYTFKATDGNHPTGVFQGTDGNLYGTTGSGGGPATTTPIKASFSGNGTIFKLAPDPVDTEALWHLTTLHRFDNTATGATITPGVNPLQLIQAPDGTLYGITNGINPKTATTPLGPTDFGTVFKMTTLGTAFTTIYTFTGTDGVFPNGLVLKNDGTLAGVTGFGGPTYNTTIPIPVYGDGTCFTMDNGGNNFKSIPFDQQGPAGSQPDCLIQGQDGNLYGTNASSLSLAGGFFEILPNNTPLHLAGFPANNGLSPNKIVQGTDGNLYGTTLGGGVNFAGTFFQVTPSGELTSLASFIDANLVPGSLLKNSDAPGAATLNFYGTLASKLTDHTAASYEDGQIYRLTVTPAPPSASPTATLTTLYPFTGGADGDTPTSLIRALNGTIYGTTLYGGSSAGDPTFGGGTLFSYDPSQSAPSYLSIGNSAGTNFNNLATDAASNLYGSTATELFELTSGAPGTFNQISNPFSGVNSLIVAQDGLHLYGSTATDIFSLGTSFPVPAPVSFFHSASTLAPGGLVQTPDGTIYGITSGNDAGDNDIYGRIFSVDTAGVYKVIYDFAAEPNDPIPSSLILGNDGNLYGATLGSKNVQNASLKLLGIGSIFRVVLPGAPSIYPYSNPPELGYTPAILDNSGNVITPATSSATITAQANARGYKTSVTIVYATDRNLTSPVTTSVKDLLGSFTTPVGITLTGLKPATTYYYQLMASNSQGTVSSPLGSFTTYDLPTVPTNTLTETSKVATTDGKTTINVTLTGMVDAKDSGTTVEFQFRHGTEPFQTIYIRPTVLTGGGYKRVTYTVRALPTGQPYSFRIIATNSAGSITSDAIPFTTEAAPVVTISDAPTAPPDLTSYSATFSATVNSAGSDTTASFLIFAKVGQSYVPIVANPPIPTYTIPASTLTTQTKILTQPNLAQAGDFYFRFTATNEVGTSTTPLKKVKIGSLFSRTNPAPGAAPASTKLSTLTVTLNLPPAPGAYSSDQAAKDFSATNLPLLTGWRLHGEQDWRNSGEKIVGLEAGNNRIVEYRPVAGYLAPPSEGVAVPLPTTSTNGNLTMARNYSPVQPPAATGGFIITLTPANLAVSKIIAKRPQWRLKAGTASTSPFAWRNSGDTSYQSGLAPGDYLVEFKPANGYATPSPMTVNVQSGQTPTPTIQYLLPSLTDTKVAPDIIPFLSGTPNVQQNPYRYVGQIQYSTGSSIGSASGFVIKPRVVATAAHVVFDEQNLSYISDLIWLFQRDKGDVVPGAFEPNPLVPRGYLVLDGYAAQVGQLDSTATYNRDVAALYFDTPPGRGGCSGYLSSDRDTNEYLSDSTRSKILIGYPGNTSPGVMQGTPQGTPLSMTPLIHKDNSETDANGKLYQVYVNEDSHHPFTGAAGNSGGPLCIYGGPMHMFTPAAIYLGSDNGNGIVRAFDSLLTDSATGLFARAQAAAPDTNQEAGPIYSSAPTDGADGGDGNLEVHLLPDPNDPALTIDPAIVTNLKTATWTTTPGRGFLPSLGVLTKLAILGNPYQIYLTDVPGFITPLGKETYPVDLVEKNLTKASVAYHGLIQQPPPILPVTINSSTPVTLTASGYYDAAGGETAPNYAWYKKAPSDTVWKPIPGATTASYTIAPSVFSAVNAAKNNGTSYQVKVTWPYLEIPTSSSADLAQSRYSNPSVLVINRASQTITFPPPTQVGARVVLAATSDSGLTNFQYFVSGLAAHLGTSTALSVTGTGKVTVQAFQAGNTIYAPATAIVSFNVTKP